MRNTTRRWERRWRWRLRRRDLAEALLTPVARLPGPLGCWCGELLERLAAADQRDAAELRMLAARLAQEL